MKLLNLEASRYRSLREESLSLEQLNVFIGANASGKSTILDALRFLHEGVQERDFRSAVYARGGIVHLPWKGENAQQVELKVRLLDDAKHYEWCVRLIRQAYDFSIHEYVDEVPIGSPPIRLLEARAGEGWWWSGKKAERVTLKQAGTTCALAAAAADASFPARHVADFIRRWGFFDPNPYQLRKGSSGFDPSRFDPYGRNLAERLFVLRENSEDRFQQIVSATQDIVGLPTALELREVEESDGVRVYFVQREPGLTFPVYQIGASSGTLRMLALMTALFGEAEANLIGIEEPENHIHPSALEAFAQYLLSARDRVQILVTTHSPLLLDYLNEPGAVCVVRRDPDDGTRVSRHEDSNAVQKALDESGFSLGQYYETKGFGA